MSAPTEDEVADLEDAFSIDTIRVRVDVGERVYGYTKGLPTGWPEILADSDGEVLATATQIAGSIVQAIVQEFAPHLIPEGEPLIPVREKPQDPGPETDCE